MVELPRKEVPLRAVRLFAQESSIDPCRLCDGQILDTALRTVSFKHAAPTYRVAFVRYRFETKPLFLGGAVKGDCSSWLLGTPSRVAQHLRITHGLKPAYLIEALNRASFTLTVWQEHAEAFAG